MKDKKQFLQLIKSNIKNFGYHLTIVNSFTEPRYCYTIGLKDVFGFELVMAGGYFYLEKDLCIIFKGIVNELAIFKNYEKNSFNVETLGFFNLKKIHDSWCKMMLYGYYDYYETNEVLAYQIIPSENLYTIEIPDMSKLFNREKFPIWKYLIDKWDLPVCKESSSVINLKVLKGEKITEVMRWEEDNWEMFAGHSNDVEEKDIRILPISVIIAIDNTLFPSLDLLTGKGFYRNEKDNIWHDWG